MRSIAIVEQEYRRRKRLRLSGFDYSQIGAYFVTICANRRQCLFGEIVNGQMKRSGIGEAIVWCWNAIPNHFPMIVLDAFVMMPNHVHGILLFTDIIGAGHARPLPVVIASFKSAVSRQIHAGIWQRSYWDRIIRNEDELNRFRTYIDRNPAHWPKDPENL